MRVIILFIFVFLASCSKDKDLFEDAINIVTAKTELKQEKQILEEDFKLDDLNFGDIANNRGNLSFANLHKLHKVKKYKIGKRSDKLNYQYFSSYIDKNQIVTMLSKQHVVRYNLENQQIIWEVELPVTGEINFLSGGILRVEDFFLITPGDNFIYALDYNNGELLWSKNAGANIRSKPVLKGDNIYVQTITNKAFSIDYKSGETIWFNDFSSKLTSVFGSGDIVATDNIVVIPSSKGYLTSLEKDTGKRVWLEKVMKPGTQKSEFTLTDIESAMILDGNTLYVASFNDSFIAANLQTGRRYWHREIGVYQDFWLSGDYLFAIDINNKVFALDRNDGEIIWVNDYLSKIKGCNSKPFIINGELAIISSLGKILFFDSRTGEFMYKRSIEKDVCQDFYLNDNELYLLTPKGSLYKYAG